MDQVGEPRWKSRSAVLLAETPQPRPQFLAYKMETISPEYLTNIVDLLIWYNRATARYLCCPQPLGFRGRPSSRERTEWEVAAATFLSGAGSPVA